MRTRLVLSPSSVSRICVAIGILSGVALAHAAPGVPADPTVVWSEDFENLPTPTSSGIGTDLLAYTGTNPSGQQYTADPVFRITSNACNGIVTAWNLNPSSGTMITHCANAQNSWNGVQQLAEVIGRYAGLDATASRNNYALAGFTTGGGPYGGAVQFRTVDNIPLVLTNRFLTARIDVAAMDNCSNDATRAPLLRFSLVQDDATEVQISPSDVNACQDAQAFATAAVGSRPSQTALAKTVVSSGALLFSGNSVGFMLRNMQGSGNGNDAAFDNAQILDVTPTLDHAFSPQNITLDETATLTFTVTNTSELLEKDGWEFTANLPAGLTVTDIAGTTCAGSTTVAAPAGSTVVTVAHGSLAQDASSCTITLTVQADATGTFTANADDLDLLALNPPQEATLNVTRSVSSAQDPAPVPALGLAGLLALSLGVMGGGLISRRKLR